jgi:predicted histone-like DNA-binding protein
MALKIKAKERKFKIGKYAGDWRYVMQPELYSSLTQSKVIKEAALRSGVSEGVMQACWDAAGEVIKAWLPEGHSIPLPGLGSCRFGLSASSVDDVNKVKTSLIKTRRIIFTPAVELKDELRNTAVVITCYDREGNEVKRVTSADDGTIEEPENTTETGENDGGNGGGSGNGGNSGGNGGNSGGSGSITTGVAAPTIDGEAAFTTSTQVTMSGPEGAEIRYTTDGSTPTASSTLYTEPITVSSSVTLKAIAIKDGQSSEVTTKQFVKSDGGADDPSGFEGA